MSKLICFRSGLIAVLIAFSAFSLFAQENDAIKAEARGATDSMEAQLAGQTDIRQRYSIMRNLPSAAFVAGDLEKAGSAARELLQIGEEIDRKSSFKGSILSHTTHVGNTVLGLTELKKGNVAAAKEHLLASARFSRTADPVRMSFGPSMALAKVLAVRGERKVVLEYLELCSTFWKHSNGKIDEWKSELSAGRVPDFGGNARYVLEEWRYRR